jgi:ketosteroid isomerase-like protein
LRFWSEFKDTATDVHELIDAGDAVVARVTFRGKGKTSGIDVEMDVFQIWTLRDGKVVRGTAAWSQDAFKVAGLSE